MIFNDLTASRVLLLNYFLDTITQIAVFNRKILIVMNIDKQQNILELHKKSAKLFLLDLSCVFKFELFQLVPKLVPKDLELYKL